MSPDLLLLPELSFYRATYECDPPLVRGAGQRPLSAEEVTESCELLLAMAQRHQCTCWLLDGRHHQREQPQELHDWLREEYLPRVRAVLGRPFFIAFLVPPFVWAGLLAKGYSDPQDWHTHAVHLAWFTHEAPALEWLAQQRDHQAASSLPAVVSAPENNVQK
ncbi:hypothetical protein Q3A66_09600 [Hymenobacter sp. BT770]|uniref:hypothetical protein n=1 Tax=Hymenobacter sp. BT770 TaxID=2886942 RepID=UPI001D103F9E|nr:hypothetical protein [Hymenobacter sp. BT770]MCC3153204.1 hypothetical protein [Hymenobacter sp. BT770]MDO3415322.1 hypothetical protein [Hymenobacter sp. BT770]